MEKGFLDKVEDNAALRIWSEKRQQEKGDSLSEGYVLELWDFTRYWNPAYSCFTFGKVDMVPTVEEYTTLLRCLMIQVDKAHFRAANVPTFLKRLMDITGMSEQWVTACIKEKGDNNYITWKSLQDLILVHLDTRRKIDIFALSIYGLVIFPKVLGHIEDAVSDMFDRLEKMITPVPAILAESFRSLNVCRRVDEGRFFGCVQLLLNLWLPKDRKTSPKKYGWKFSEVFEMKMLKAERVRKGNNKAEEDLDSLNTDYKKLCLSIKTAGLGNTPGQRRQEILEENIRTNQWERKFQDARAREDALKRKLLESQDEKARLKA
ncbi:hypothetical protein Gogos_017845 [Gossypium gossypioides]|uniref:DUF7745 domain-containing protein n=1 Tax=Gossypium gossypioides TaxID=34282 RepID=A0A7J9BC98_GOSGO|nr:hypothetical protein [Gossypium gossypioides]